MTTYFFKLQCHNPYNNCLSTFTLAFSSNHDFQQIGRFGNTVTNKHYLEVILNAMIDGFLHFSPSEAHPLHAEYSLDLFKDWKTRGNRDFSCVIDHNRHIFH